MHLKCIVQWETKNIRQPPAERGGEQSHLQASVRVDEMRPPATCDDHQPVHAPPRTLGIDLAAQPRETAACLITWGTDGAQVGLLDAGYSDDALIESIDRTTPEKVAVDAPFGWPVDFIAALSAHGAGEPWPDVAIPSLRLRATDLTVISETRQQPLSVSSDRIAVTAMRCARLLTRLKSAGHQVARDGSGTVVEVYPAAALRQWSLDPRGYKGTKAEQIAKRSQLVETLLIQWPWLQVTDHERRLMASSDHLLDALLCAVIARAVVAGKTQPVPSDCRELASIEGWIHLPVRERLGQFDPTPQPRSSTANRGLRSRSPVP